MTVQEIIILASRYLRLDEEVEGYFKSINTSGKVIAETLLKYFTIFRFSCKFGDIADNRLRGTEKESFATQSMTLIFFYDSIKF